MRGERGARSSRVVRCATERCALKHLTLWREQRATARGVNSLLITRPEHNLTWRSRLVTSPLAISARIISCLYQSAVFTFCRLIVECRRVLHSSRSLSTARVCARFARSLSQLVCVFGKHEIHIVRVMFSWKCLEHECVF